jgi:hypothetical protein
MYEISKVRLLEGVSKTEINEEIGPIEFGVMIDSINGDINNMETKLRTLNKLYNLLKAEKDYLRDSIGIDEFCGRMINNAIYDKINMNTFNFVNASFDNLLWRYPTAHEFFVGYDMIESNLSGLLFGQDGQNKDDYVDILTKSREFYQGMIIWAYSTLLAREPSSAEVESLMQDFYYTGDFQEVQKQIIRTDEYAHFD